MIRFPVVSACLLATAALALGSAALSATACATCLMDLETGDAWGCRAAPWIRPFGSPGDSNGDGWREACVEVTLDPANGCRRALVDVLVGAPPTGYSLNIGDSSTNDANCGDGGTQSNDAEMWLRDDELVLCSNDNANHDFLYRLFFESQAGEWVRFEVADNLLRWVGPNLGGSSSTPVSQLLFALDGQPDSEGSVNYDIYVCANRVIRTFGARLGTGISYMRVVVEE